MDFEPNLLEEVESLFDTLDNGEVGSDEYKAGIDGVTKLMDRAIDIKKIENDVKEKELARQHELRVRQMSLDADAKEKELARKEEAKEKELARNHELKLKRMQLLEDAKSKKQQARNDLIDVLAKHGLTLIQMVTTTGTIWLLASAAFTYEEKGTICSPIGRKILSLLVPKF